MFAAQAGGGLTAEADHGVTAFVKLSGAVQSADGPDTRDPLALAAELCRRLGISNTAALLLARRGLHQAESAKDFLKPRLGQLSSPDSMADRNAAADRLARAIRTGERICVFG